MATGKKKKIVHTQSQKYTKAETATGKKKEKKNNTCESIELRKQIWHWAKKKKFSLDNKATDANMATYTTYGWRYE